MGPYRDGVLQVRVTRPPADGAANQAVQRLLAIALGVPPSAISLVSGANSRHKRFAVGQLTEAQLGQRLARLGD